MSTRTQLKSRVLKLPDEPFEDLAMMIFRYQATENPVYHAYLRYRHIELDSITKLEQIPFLPIEFFKTQHVISGDAVPEIIFESSGTTGVVTSRHAVADPLFYKQISTQLFERAYGPLTGYHILALLPSYLERTGSSLVYMVQQFIERSGSAESGFFLHDTERLLTTLRRLLSGTDQRRVVLLGVTFALLDLAERPDLPRFSSTDRLIVMETGGMKGRRREMLREEVHAVLTRAFKVPAIHSEYGMTELLSQAYSMGEGVFQLPPSMRILLRDTNDPLSLLGPTARTGGINVIDLANVDSCSFIETKDLGSYGPQSGTFRVLGRFDNSDLRGCNLLVS